MPRTVMTEELMSESQQQAEALVESIENEVDKIKILVKKLEKGNTINPRKDKAFIQEEVGNCFIMIEGLELHVQGLRKDKASHYYDLHRKFKKNLEDLEQRAERAGTGKGAKKSTDGYEDDDAQLFTKEQGIDYGNELIDDIDIALKNAQKHLAHAEEEAVKATETVMQQREQFEAMIEQTYEIEDEMKRARQITQIMLRRVATDQVMWCLIGLIFIGIVAIIVMKSA